jgi:adenylate kinase family enzyme
MLRRIVITGCSGSGKSTLARQLGQQLGLPVVHLDVLYWSSGWQERETEDSARASPRRTAATPGSARVTALGQHLPLRRAWSTGS